MPEPHRHRHPGHALRHPHDDAQDDRVEPRQHRRRRRDNQRRRGEEEGVAGDTARGGGRVHRLALAQLPQGEQREPHQHHVEVVALDESRRRAGQRPALPLRSPPRHDEGGRRQRDDREHGAQRRQRERERVEGDGQQVPAGDVAEHGREPEQGRHPTGNERRHENRGQPQRKPLKRVQGDDLGGARPAPAQQGDLLPLALHHRRGDEGHVEERDRGDLDEQDRERRALEVGAPPERIERDRERAGGVAVVDAQVLVEPEDVLAGALEVPLVELVDVGEDVPAQAEGQARIAPRHVAQHGVDVRQHGRNQAGIGDGRGGLHVAVADPRPERSVRVLDRDDAREHGRHAVAVDDAKVAGELRLQPLGNDAVAVVDLFDEQEVVARLQPRHGRGARAHHHLHRPIRPGGRGQVPFLHGDVRLEPLDGVQNAERRALPRLLARLPDGQPRRFDDDGAVVREPAEPLVDAVLDSLAHNDRVGCGELLRLDAGANRRLTAQLVAHGELEPEVGHGAGVDGRARQQGGGDQHAQREHGQHPPAGRAVAQQQPPEDGKVPHDRTG